MALRKKLYYDILVAGGSVTIGGAQPFADGLGPGEIVFAIRIVAGTGAGFGVGGASIDGADADRYGNVLAPSEFAGATGNFAKAKQAIGAWWAPGSSNVGPAPTDDICIDFIAPTGAASLVAAPAIDPATLRRVFLRGHAIDPGPRIYSGTIYVQRQHTIEV
jgi:hypothetical protein